MHRRVFRLTWVVVLSLAEAFHPGCTAGGFRWQQQQRRRCHPLVLHSTTEKEEEPFPPLDWSRLSAPRDDSSSELDPQDFLAVSAKDDPELGNVHIPTDGVSISDAIDAAQKDRFVTDLVPIQGLTGVAQLYTRALQRGTLEPMRYLIATRPPVANATAAAAATDYVLVDLPPFAPQLVARMKAFMGPTGTLRAVLVTSRDSIHYDAAPAVYVARRADLELWRKAFPDMAVAIYRLDTPRDCRPLVTQVLDGYGPFAMLENGTFVETGRPLTREEWDFATTEDIFSGRRGVPEVDERVLREMQEQFSPESIRRREEGRSVLALYTPGHSFGSMSYVFPFQSLVASGFTIPIEETRAMENNGADTGPALDCRGYITTSRAGVRRQIESARRLTDAYVDRFRVVLPSRGKPMFLTDDVAARRRHLHEIFDQYDRIGEIYERLGITTPNEEE